MNYDIAAIETNYKARTYRSRLEARWAAFFDLLGWQYEYEPLDLNGWFPDFVLPAHNSYGRILVEIKPIVVDAPEIRTKMDKACPANAPDFSEELLLVGLMILPSDSWRAPRIGWLRDEQCGWGEGLGQTIVRLSDTEAIKYDLFHNCGSWQGRIHNSNHHSRSDWDWWRFNELFQEAGNITQYQYK